MLRVYLDHNATCPPTGAAQAALRRILSTTWANPHSPHAEGQAARLELEAARAAVARLAGVDPAAVFFTSGGTEAAHAALLGVARAGGPGRVVVSALEHPALLAAAETLQHEGFEVVQVPPGTDGVVRADRFLEACLPGTVVAALMVANKEIGTLQPVGEVAGVLARRGIPLVADAVQAPGKLPTVLPPGEHVVGILSAHKLGGVAGVGAVIAHPERRLRPLLPGGAQERGRRGGTPATALAVAMGVAAADLAAGAEAARGKMALLRDAFEAGLLARIEAAHVLAAQAPRLPNTCAFRLPGVPGEVVVAALDLAGVAVATGSACSTGAGQPSRALLAMGHAPQAAAELVRVSLGRETTAADIDFALAALQAAMPGLQRHLARGSRR
jgi:cysteine desulfurase